MRATTLVTAAIWLFGCAQGGTEPAGAADIAPSHVAPPAPAPPAPASNAGPCDPSVHPAVKITDSGACPGVVPSTATCAADLLLCNGNTNRAVAGTSDGGGSAVLSCANNDVGPARFNALFVPVQGGFVSKMPLGVDARPLSDGFVSSAGSTQIPPPEYDFVAHDGTLRVSHAGGFLIAGAGGALIVRAAGGSLGGEAIGADGVTRSTVTIATLTAPADSLMLGGAMDVSGAALVLWQVYGEAKASARWIGADGAALTGVFPVQPWLDFIPDAAPLAGGGVALAAPPPSGANGPVWRSTIAPGATAEQPAPQWLTSRGSFFLLPGGKAMAFGAEIVAAGGVVCGTVDLGAPLVGVGVDGTAFTALDAKSFRLYPQLFR